MLLVPTTSVGYDAEKEERAEQEAKMAKISAIEEAKEWLCWRALEQFTKSDLTIDDLPVGEVLQQLKELSDKVDCYGQGVRIQLGASVTEPQLAKRLTTRTLWAWLRFSD